MRYLIILLMLSGCATEKNKESSLNVIENEFTATELPELTFRDSLNYNGQIDYINENSWVFSSHTNDLCIGKLNSPCRKVNASFVDGLANDRITRLDFELMISDLNIESDMYFNIIYQDWVRIRADDSNGNHPITTLKLKIFDGRLYLAHYDNSWQWDYIHPENDIWDSLHEHQENRLNGLTEVEIGVTYNISVTTYDSGRFIFKVNGVVISDAEYQTKSLESNHSIQFGQYWNKGYNTDNNLADSMRIRIDNLIIYKK